MGNKSSKGKTGSELRYNIHGVQYLPVDTKSPKKKPREANSGSPGAEFFCSNGSPTSDGIPNGINGDPASRILLRENTELSLQDAQWQDQEYPFENIVMSGGGSKGYAYIGALKALEDCGVLSRVRRVAGSSAGAICGAMVAVGCSPQEVTDLFAGDIKWLFHDQQCACCCCIPKICKLYGIHPAKRFLRIYGQHLAKKVGNPDITFGELYRDYGRELCVVVTNLSKMCSEYCHAKTTPDLPIRTAVRMSMSFPMVYESVKVEINGSESLYTDGGTLDNYPVHCFDGPDLELNHNSEKSRLYKDAINEKTLGLYVVAECAIDYKIWTAMFGKDIPYKPSYLPNTKLARNRLEDEFQKRKRKRKSFSMKEFVAELRSESDHKDEPMFHYETCNRSTVDIRSFKDYFVTTIETLLISQRKLHIKPEDSKRTVAINCGYIGTNDYVLEPDDREFMIRQGYDCTRKFLTQYTRDQRQRKVLQPNQNGAVQNGRIPKTHSLDLSAVNSGSITTADRFKKSCSMVTTGTSIETAV